MLATGRNRQENRRKLAEKMKLTLKRILEIWEPLPPLAECAEAPDDGYVDAAVAVRPPVSIPPLLIISTASYRQLVWLMIYVRT